MALAVLIFSKGFDCRLQIDQWNPPYVLLKTKEGVTVGTTLKVFTHTLFGMTMFNVVSQFSTQPKNLKDHFQLLSPLIVTGKVIIHKLRGEQLRFGLVLGQLAILKKIWANHEQLLKAVFMDNKNLIFFKDIVASALKSYIK